MEHIRNPIEWSWDQVRFTWRAAGSVGRAIRGGREYRHAHLAIRRIGVADLGQALARGFSDFGAFRTGRYTVFLFFQSGFDEPAAREIFDAICASLDSNAEIEA